MPRKGVRQTPCWEIPTNLGVITTPEEGYYQLAHAILFLVCEEYGFIYERYITGHTSETVYNRHREYMENDFVALLIDATLNDTPEGVMRNIERLVRRDVEEGRRGRFKKLH